jgi:hypothetical protein
LQTHTRLLFKIVFFAVNWVVAVPYGLGVLLNYETKPGSIGAVPQTWPGSQLQPTPGRATLVMLAHPHCPCTRASVGELAQIMAQSEGRIAAYVLFLKPTGSDSTWENTDLWRSAAAVPGVTVMADKDGAEARRFGSETSGHTLLFDENGRLLFSGGITRSRGHSGDNAGRSAIISFLNNHTPDRAQTSVFGCSFSDPAAES